VLYSIAFSAEEQMLIEQYALRHGSTVPDVIRRATMEMIEDELDAVACREALENYKKNPKTYSVDEIKKDLGLL